MKRYLSLIALTLFAFVALATDPVTLEGLSDNVTFKKWGADYTLTNTTANEYEFQAAKHYPNTQSYTVNLTKVSGTQNVTVTLYGKCFEDDSYTEITSGTSGSITTTATVTITNNAPNRYRYFKVKLQGDASAVTTITEQSFKMFIE